MNHFILFAAFSLVILSIIGYSFYFSNKAVVKRKLRNAPFKKISQFRHQTIAKTTGKIAYVIPPLISPLSQRECSHYHIHVEQKNKNWSTLIEEEVSSKIILKDGDDYALINHSSLKSFIVQDKVYSSGFLNDAGEKLEAYLKSKGKKSDYLIGLNKTLRYQEGILEKDEKVTALGQGEWKTAIELGLPEHLDKVLVINPIPKKFVYLSDDFDVMM